MNKMDSPQTNMESHRVLIFSNADSRRFTRIKKSASIRVNLRFLYFSSMKLCAVLWWTQKYEERLLLLQQ